MKMAITVGNIFAFFTEENPNSPTCQQVDVYEDFLRNTIEFHFESGLIIKLET